MVSKRSCIVYLLLLLFISLLAVGSWLLTTRSGALWLLDRFGAEGPAKVALKDLRGSLFGGLELQGLDVDWPGGLLSVDQLHLEWQPKALLQQRLQIDSIKGGVLDLRLKSSANKTASVSELMPDLTPLLTSLGGWSIALQHLQLDVLLIAGAEGQPTQLQQITGKVQGNATQLSLDDLGVDGDWGRWRGALLLTTASSLLTGHLEWKLPDPVGPFETLEAQLSLTRTGDGKLFGPVTFRSHSEKAPGYRLAGNLALDLDGLELHGLQFDHGSQADGFARGGLLLDWRSLFSWQADLDVTDLNLNAELGSATKISGPLHLSGEQSRYAGRIDLHNALSGWQLLSLRGELAGDTDQLELKQLEGRLLGGDVQGEVRLDWRDGISSHFNLKGANLQLAEIPGGPDGNIDLQVDGWLKKPAGKGLQLGGSAQISKGILQGRDFSGDLRADWQGGRQLRIDHLDLSGAWGQLKVQGDLQRHLQFNLALLDAATLWQPLEGQGELAGWLAWTTDWPHGEVSGHLTHLGYQDLKVADLVLEGGQPTAGADADLRLKINHLQKGEVDLAALNVQMQGLPSAHRIQLQVNESGALVEMELQGELQKQAWLGKVAVLELSAQNIESYRLAKPFALRFDPAQMSISELMLQGDKGGSLSLDASWNRRDNSRRAEGAWRLINLSWLRPWLAGMQLKGESSGQVNYVESADGEISGTLQADYVGAFVYAEQTLQLDRVQIGGRWDKQGLNLNADILERSGGKLHLTAGSSDEADFSLPQTAALHLDLESFPLDLLNAQLPADLALNGLLRADITGHWFSGGRFTLAGEAGVEQGILQTQYDQSRLEIPLEQAALVVNWQQEQLTVEISLGLGEGDGLSGVGQLQLPARWPFDKPLQQPLSGELKFQLGKLRSLSLLAPEALADFSGEFGGILRLTGSLQEPNFEGNFELLNGKFSIQPLGIVVDQVGLKGVLGSDQLNIEEVTLDSGEGKLHGRGDIRLDGWKPERFNFELKGDHVLLANLPELRVISSLDLRLAGDPADLTLGGLVKIPELKILNWNPPRRIARSEDVIYANPLPVDSEPKTLKFKLDLGIELGDQVVVKDRGLDVKFKGKVHLSSSEKGEVLAQGQINIPVGKYSAYGVKLPITSGRIAFDGPASNPALDIVAQKKIDDVLAGVAVGGTARKPDIRLISTPQLEDVDILSYIVLGRPAPSGSDESSVLTVGKYLGPDLYVSYGQSISGSASAIGLRYSPGERFDIESQWGESSSADIFYKFEFD